MGELNSHKPVRVKNPKVGRHAAAAASTGAYLHCTRTRTLHAHAHAGRARNRAIASAGVLTTRAHTPNQAHSFEIDVDTTGFGEYSRGGIVTQFKEPKTLAFKSLAEVGPRGLRFFWGGGVPCSEGAVGSWGVGVPSYAQGGVGSAPSGRSCAARFTPNAAPLVTPTTNQPNNQPTTTHLPILKRRQSIESPGEFLLSDFSKMERPALLHLAFQALDKFQVCVCVCGGVLALGWRGARRKGACMADAVPCIHALLPPRLPTLLPTPSLQPLPHPRPPGRVWVAAAPRQRGRRGQAGGAGGGAQRRGAAGRAHRDRRRGKGRAAQAGQR